MRDSDFKRMKHHEFPGDISTQEKASFRAKPSLHKRAKTYSKMVRTRTRAVLKERSLKEISVQREEGPK